jgi:hypothetical protein
MKALKIDVVNKTITEIQLEHTKEIYEIIGNGCHTFCAPVEFDNQDTIFADDEALLQSELQGCFMFPDWKYPIVGNAVVLGTDYEGDVCDAKSSTDDLLELIIFGNKEVAEMHRDSALSQPMVFSPFDNWE